MDEKSFMKYQGVIESLTIREMSLLSNLKTLNRSCIEEGQPEKLMSRYMNKEMERLIQKLEREEVLKVDKEVGLVWFPSLFNNM